MLGVIIKTYLWFGIFGLIGGTFVIVNYLYMILWAVKKQPYTPYPMIGCLFLFLAFVCSPLHLFWYFCLLDPGVWYTIGKINEIVLQKCGVATPATYALLSADAEEEEEEN